MNKEEISQKTSEEPNKSNAADDETIDYLGNYIDSKRDAKSLIKLHEDVIDYYINQTIDVNTPTLKEYGHSIADFINFDPTINLEQLKSFKKYTIQKKIKFQDRLK